jgi:plasmid rolling circle replication initiator protein Rep
VEKALIKLKEEYRRNLKSAWQQKANEVFKNERKDENFETGNSSQEVPIVR